MQDNNNNNNNNNIYHFISYGKNIVWLTVSKCNNSKFNKEVKLNKINTYLKHTSCYANSHYKHIIKVVFYFVMFNINGQNYFYHHNVINMIFVCLKNQRLQRWNLLFACYIIIFICYRNVYALYVSYILILYNYAKKSNSIRTFRKLISCVTIKLDLFCNIESARWVLS